MIKKGKGFEQIKLPCKSSLPKSNSTCFKDGDSVDPHLLKSTISSISSNVREKQKTQST
jgi:hypothetical protein